jgi:hypothetical protein
MVGSPDVHRAGIRRILACPYCHGPQGVPSQPVRFVLGCRECHRVFRVTEAGAERVSDRADKANITSRRRPVRVFIDQRVEPAGGGGKQALARSTGNGLMGMLRESLRGLQSRAIALLALAAAAAALYSLLAVLDSTHTAVRRALPEGSMLSVRRDAGESDHQPGRKAREPRNVLSVGAASRHQE